MSDRHVRPGENGWHVEKPDAKRPSAVTDTQAEAIKRALEIVANDGGGNVVVHGMNGAVRETRTVEASTTSVGDAARLTAVATADDVSDAADEVAENASETAHTVADLAGETAHAVGETTRATASEVADNVAEVAQEAGEELAEDSDRAARVGVEFGERLEGASRRTGDYIHTVTEQVAGPLDRASHALNPVRIAGRTVGVAVAGALHLGARITTRGSRGVRDSVHAVTDRT
jgi:hypothetical protein